MASNGKKGRGGAREAGRKGAGKPGAPVEVVAEATPAGAPAGSANGANPPAPGPDTIAAAGAADVAPGEGARAPESPAPESEAARESARMAPAHPVGAAWAEPLARLDRRWTRLEQRLVTAVLMSQILALVAWVFLNGLSEPVNAQESAGTVFRSIFGAVALGLLARRFTRGRVESQRSLVTLGAVVVGLAVGPLWRGLGVAYFDNWKGWLQEGSTLTLVGGLPGLATRLTLWLALIGGSLATGAGKHIHIDVVYRFLPARFRVPASLVNYVAAAAVCFAGSWGFVDHIAIDAFEANQDLGKGAKLERILDGLGRHAFFTRKQLGLDLRSLPHVLQGQPYDQWLTAAEWNAWVRDGGFESRFPKDQIDSLLVPADSGPHTPAVIAPDRSGTRGILVHSLGLVFPFGLLAIGLRFLLRALLTLSGHLSVDPDEAHKEEIGTHVLAGAAAKGSA